MFLKVCTACEETRPETEFWLDKRKQRRIAICHDCRYQRAAAWRAANVDTIRKKNREWQLKNPERVRAAMERWKQRNPGVANERARVWFEKNKPLARARNREAQRKLKAAAYAAYGGFKCACCGETTEAFLSLDHVNNDGAQHRKISDRRKIYHWLRDNKYPTGFQVLCMNCNFGKARNGGICPHKNNSEGSTTRRKP